MLVDEALSPSGGCSTVCGHILLESLNVLESSGGQSGLDDLDPCADAVNVFPDFLPLEDPCSVYFVSGSRPGHALEAFEIVPSFEFFQFCLIDFCLVLNNLLLRQVVAVALDDSLELYLFRQCFGVIDFLRFKTSTSPS